MYMVLSSSLYSFSTSLFMVKYKIESIRTRKHYTQSKNKVMNVVYSFIFVIVMSILIPSESYSNL